MDFNVIIVGGGPAGVITALTAKSVHPAKSVCLVKDIGDGVIPCAIPYMMQTLSDPKQNASGDMVLEEAGIIVKIGEIVSLNTKAHTATLADGEILTYEKIVLATGTLGFLPPIPGVDKQGIYTVHKSLSAMTTLREKIHAAKNVAIIGGGFIGVEFADELSKIPDLKVHLIEILPKLLFTAFDDEFCDDIAQTIDKQGIKLHLNTRVTSINGGKSVQSISLDNGVEISADLVLISVGARPSSKLAEEAGIRVIENGSIWVDDYMRTDAEDVFAVGDCALKRDFFTRKAAPVWLASTATAEARNAGTNMYGIRVLHQIQGTIAAFSTQIGNISFASTGMTCRSCEKEGFRIISATAEAPDRHPGMLPNAQMMRVKLAFADRSGIILGGQVSGGPSVGELINVIALAVQKKVTVRELDMMQIATHPLLTSAPTVHPLINAAHQALAKLRASD